ncbi:MAG: YciI family protein [Conexibacter sp.]|nr:YciI family protein [Conexibacter sp.]
MTFTQDLRQSGALVAGDGFQGTETATTVRVRDAETQLTDGPFAETDEVLSGYYLIDVADLEAAVAWAAKIPGASYGSVEVRPVRVFR